MSSTPSIWATRHIGVEPGISQRVISHGMSPTTVPGATTKNAAEAAAAFDVCMFYPPSTSL